jgi:hypothetical protein
VTLVSTLANILKSHPTSISTICSQDKERFVFFKMLCRTLVCCPRTLLPDKKKNCNVSVLVNLLHKSPYRENICELFASARADLIYEHWAQDSLVA